MSFHLCGSSKPFEGVALRDLNNGMWRVTEAFYFRYNDNVIIHVPAGFESDLFSIPRAARWLYPKAMKRGNAAAIIHDYIISQLHGVYSREFADKIFCAALKAQRMKPKRLALIVAGVKGYTKWLKTKKQLVNTLTNL